MKNTRLQILLGTILVLLFVSSCGTKAEQVPLVEGNIVYIRIQEYKTKSLSDANPKGSVTTVNFGQDVNLIQKNNSMPTMWLVSTGDKQVWIPEYMLTANKNEIDFLKQSNRIPKTMTFIYKEDTVKAWGLIRLGFLVVDAEGTFVTAEGSSQVAFENNGVLFDKTAVDYEWKNPMVFSNSKKTFKFKLDWLYYYVGNDEWDCIDLIKLATCK